MELFRESTHNFKARNRGEILAPGSVQHKTKCLTPELVHYLRDNFCNGPGTYGNFSTPAAPGC